MSNIDFISSNMKIYVPSAYLTRKVEKSFNIKIIELEY